MDRERLFCIQPKGKPRFYIERRSEPEPDAEAEAERDQDSDYSMGLETEKDEELCFPPDIKASAIKDAVFSPSQPKSIDQDVVSFFPSKSKYTELEKTPTIKVITRSERKQHVKTLAVLKKQDPFEKIVLCSQRSKPVDSFLPDSPERQVNAHFYICFGKPHIQCNFLHTYDTILLKTMEFSRQLQKQWQNASKKKNETVEVPSSSPSEYELKVFSRYFDEETGNAFLSCGEYVSCGKMPKEEDGVTPDVDLEQIERLRLQLSTETHYPRMRPGCWMLKEWVRLNMKKEARQELYDLFQFQISHSDFTEQEAWHAAICQVNSARRLLKNVSRQNW